MTESNREQRRREARESSRAVDAELRKIRDKPAPRSVKLSEATAGDHFDSLHGEVELTDEEEDSE